MCIRDRCRPADGRARGSDRGGNPPPPSGIPYIATELVQGARHGNGEQMCIRDRGITVELSFSSPRNTSAVRCAVTRLFCVGARYLLYNPSHQAHPASEPEVGLGGHSMSRKVADVLWDMLANAGVKRCYGIVGDALNPVIDALRRNGKIEFIPVSYTHLDVYKRQMVTRMLRRAFEFMPALERLSAIRVWTGFRDVYKRQGRQRIAHRRSAESLEYRLLDVRLIERFRRDRRGRVGAVGHRFRHARLDSVSLGVVRRFRNAAQLWAGEPSRRDGHCVVDG